VSPVGPLPLRFRLERHDDETGISGVGAVAYGVKFVDGVVVMRWCTATGPHSTTVFDSVDDVLVVHGHHGKTEIVWVDG
jgi:hypothetical protein